MKFMRHLRKKMSSMTDTNLLLTITIVVFVAMYLSAMIFIGGSFLRAQELFTMLNHNAHLIILSCGLSLVMITGGIDISVGGVTALVTMCSAVYIEEKGGLDNPNTNQIMYEINRLSKLEDKWCLTDITHKFWKKSI